MTLPIAGDNLTLIGPMGAGKSSVARELARLTSRKLVDTDRLIIQASGKSIADIFATEGEPRFRELEAEALATLKDTRRLIIATGGGIVEKPGNRRLMRELGCVIWLTASDETLYARVSRTSHRPLLQTEDPRQTLVEILARRRPMYEASAHCKVDTTTRTLPEAAATALEAAQAYFQTRTL